MPAIPSNKPYRVGRSRTGLGLFATKPIKKGAKIVRYFGPLLDSRKKKDDAIENKYLFELNGRWTIDGSVRKNVARYINHACKPNAESDVKPRKRKVVIRAIKNIEPGEEINYDYGTDYFKAYLKPIGCKCEACEKKRKKKRAEARAERLRLKAKEEKKGAEEGREAGGEGRKAAKARQKLQSECQPNERQALERQAPERPWPVQGRPTRNRPPQSPELPGSPKRRLSVKPGIPRRPLARTSKPRPRPPARRCSCAIRYIAVRRGRRHDRLRRRQRLRPAGSASPRRRTTARCWRRVHAALPAITITTSAFGIACRVPSQPTSAV